MAGRIYTKTGDKGQTSLIGGRRVSKTDQRLWAYGTVDELNSIIGVVRSHDDSLPKGVDDALTEIQNRLFNIGSLLACEDPKLRESLPGLAEVDTRRLEQWIDDWDKVLPPLKQFILPGGNVVAAHLHLARTVCRRAERESLDLADKEGPLPAQVIEYLNRLSDLFFVLARYVNHLAGRPDVPWTKG